MEPIITEERLEELMTRFKPLYRKEGKKKLWTMEIPHLRRMAFTWCPVLLEKLKSYTPVKTIQTRHECGYYGFFKPSIAEVLAHVVDDGTDWGNGFFIEMDSVFSHSSGEYQYANTQFVRI